MFSSFKHEKLPLVFYIRDEVIDDMITDLVSGEDKTGVGRLDHTEALFLVVIQPVFMTDILLENVFKGVG